MTAEVAILNRQAVALAADSAVTISGPGGTKIYTSVNKVFALSRHAPVGVMIYGNSELSGVPWETVIKVYRRRLGEARFPTLSRYAADFFAFLDRRNDLFPPKQQESELLGSFHGYCLVILAEIDQEIDRLLTGGPVSRTQAEATAAAIVRNHSRLWNRVSYLPGRTPSYVNRVVGRWSALIDGVIKDVFKKITLSESTRRQLRRIAGQLFAKSLFPEGGVSGVVVAGFGEREHFPGIAAYQVEGVVLNRLKYQQLRTEVIGPQVQAIVMPFAQREMVYLFMEGVDPDFRQMIGATLTGILNGLPDLVIGPLGLPSDTSAAVRTQIKKITDALGNEFEQRLKQYSRSRHVDPIVQSVGSLPKEELAAMAESLVNLTSFKRRVSRDLETVGGPVDVALISKGDGLVWIKRKHYFSAALNPQFMADYTR